MRRGVETGIQNGISRSAATGAFAASSHSCSVAPGGIEVTVGSPNLGRPVLGWIDAESETPRARVAHATSGAGEARGSCVIQWYYISDKRTK